MDPQKHDKMQGYYMPVKKQYSTFATEHWFHDHGTSIESVAADAKQHLEQGGWTVESKIETRKPHGWESVQPESVIVLTCS